MDSARRFEYLCTSDGQSPRNISAASIPRSYSYQTPPPFSVGSPSYSVESGSGSSRSTASSASRPRRESGSSCSSASSAATSYFPPPHNPIPNFTQQFLATPHRAGFDLPCEFRYSGCRVRFPANDIANWISHSISHFDKIRLPSKAICIFCGEHDGVFEAEKGNRKSNWLNRMHHIAEHFQAFESERNLRPDFWVIEHLWKCNSISREDFENAIKYTERPTGGQRLVSREDREAVPKEEERRDLMVSSSESRRENREWKKKDKHRHRT